MPTLTGTLAYVTGQTATVRAVSVRAPAPRTNDSRVVSTASAWIGVDGQITVDLDPGPAVLTAVLDSGPCTVDLLVADGMTTIHEAAAAALAHRR